jgi:hypothetical protein
MILRIKARESEARRWKLSSYSPGSGFAAPPRPYSFRAMREASLGLMGAATRDSGIIREIVTAERTGSKRRHKLARYLSQLKKTPDNDERNKMIRK